MDWNNCYCFGNYIFYSSSLCNSKWKYEKYTLIGDMLFVKKFSYGVPTPTIPWLEVKVLPILKEMGIK